MDGRLLSDERNAEYDVDVEQIVGALILAVGAFLGVWRGAVYAIDRLEIQLLEQRFLHREQLDSEMKRLREQLIHDRNMRDRDEARKLLDDALRTMSDATVGVAQIAASAGVFQLISGRLHQYVVSAGGGDIEERAALSTALGMGDEVFRLKLRFGKSHPLCASYAEVRDKALEILSDSSLEIESGSTLPAPERERIGDLIAEMRDEANGFLDLAIEHLGTGMIAGHLP